MAITTSQPNTTDEDAIEESLPVDRADAAWILGTLTLLAATALTGWAIGGPGGLVGAGTTGLVAAVAADARRGGGPFRPGRRAR